MNKEENNTSFAENKVINEDLRKSKLSDEEISEISGGFSANRQKMKSTIDIYLDI